MKNILVPLDFSKESINALNVANQIAKKGKAKVSLSHTIETPNYFDSPPESNETYKTELLVAVWSKIDQILNEENLSIPGTSIHVNFGHPFTHIQELIRDQVIDLVVMGSKGQRNWKEKTIGSNTDKIVRNVKCPVLIVKEVIDIDEIKDIVFATDLANTPINVTKGLKELQQLLNAKLHILKVITPGSWATEPDVKKELDHFVLVHSLTNYSLRIFNDMDVEGGIIHYSRDISAGLVAMAAHTKIDLQPLIQDNRTTERVVENYQHLLWTCGLGDRFH